MNTRSKSFNDNFQNWRIVSNDNKKTSKFTYQSAINHLKRNYLNPKSGLSFGGVNRIYMFYDKIIPIKKSRNF